MSQSTENRVISETFFSANPLATAEETKSNTTEANIHPEHKNTRAQNEHTQKKLKPGLVASYDIRPGNGCSTAPAGRTRGDLGSLKTVPAS